MTDRDRGQPTPFRALAILGSASGLTILAGVISQKVAALLLAPAGVGEVGLVTAYIGVVGVIAGLGANAALVAKLGQAAAEGDGARRSGYVHAARQNAVVFGSGLTVLAVPLSPFVAQPLLGESATALGFVAATAAGVLWAINSVEIGILIAHHRVRATARAAALTCFISPAVNLVMFLVLDRRGIIPGAFVSILLVLLVTHGVVKREVATESGMSSGERRQLLAFGLPITLSSSIGAMTALAVPVMTTHWLGEDGTGYYRAAAVLAEGYLAIIITTISQDFFPRVARTTGSDAEFSAVTEQHLRLVSAVFAPIALGVAAALPLLVTVLYSAEFRPAEELIRIQLPGDYMRLLGSVLATALLARVGSLVRFATESITAVVYVSLVAIGIAADGLRGLGISFSGTYILYVLFLFVILRTRAQLALSRHVIVQLAATTAVIALPAIVADVIGPTAASLVAAVLLVPALVPFVQHLTRRGTAGAL